jgi:hypothetical protein
MPMTSESANNRSADVSIVMLVVWSVLCTAWNFYGAVQLSSGGQALGPTASLLGAGFTMALGIVLVVVFRNWPVAYRWLVLVPAALAAFTIWNAFRLDPALWPSEFWRWAGIVLNGLGVAGSALAVRSSWRTRA